MEERQPVNDIVKFVEKDFLISDAKSLIPSTEVDSIEEFKKYLTEKINLLLEEKFDVLVNILYRIDINEKKLSELFSGKNRESIPASLAQMIIDRQLEKIHRRKLYSEGKL